MIYESPYNAGFEFRDIDIPQLILECNSRNTVPEKPAIIDGYTGQVVYTYRSLREDITTFAGFLQHQLRVGRGDVVSYLSLNTTYYPIIIHSILAAGATVSAFNPAYRPEELAHSLQLARPAYILVQSELLENLEAALLLLPTDVPKPEIHVLDGESERYPQHDVQSLLSQREHVAQYQRVQRTPKEVADDVAFICFSSGTSGLVKGVKLTHRNVVANVHQQSQCLDSMYNPDTVFTLVVPFYHILGLAGFCVQYIANGAPIVVFKRFDMPEFLESISRDKVTHINVVPPIALALLQSPLTSKADFSSVKCLMNAAAPLKQSLADALCKRMGCILTQWYGMTEASPSIISQREEEAHVRNTIGRLLPGIQMRIVDEIGKDLPRGRPGELLIRGPNVMKGYVGPPEMTETVVQDGWLKSGDVGYVDDDDFVYLVDRLKELIKVKGHQVAPAELEALLLSHPAVSDAAVCGVYLEDEATEYPIAYITTNSPISAHAQLAGEVRNFVDDQVAHYKRLQGGLHILDAIPRNPAGKILRRSLPAKTDPAVAVAQVMEMRRKRGSKL